MPMKILKLEDVKLTKREEDVLEDVMSNGPKLNQALKDADLFNADMVLKALALELRTKKRLGTVAKLAGHLKGMLSQIIDDEIHKYAASH